MFEQVHDAQELQTLLNEYNEYPERREQMVAEIEQRFRRPLGILVLDSSGFTRSVHSMGIIHFLALLERLGRMVLPLITRNGGRLLKREADNVFAVFPDAVSAVRCAAQILHDVKVANEPLPAAEEIDVSLGVGYGEVLLVGDNDLYGDEMNLACKLGEDLAERHELLVTEAARVALGPDAEWSFEDAEFSISGLQLKAYRFRADV